MCQLKTLTTALHCLPENHSHPPRPKGVALSWKPRSSVISGFTVDLVPREACPRDGFHPCHPSWELLWLRRDSNPSLSGPRLGTLSRTPTRHEQPKICPGGAAPTLGGSTNSAKLDRTVPTLKKCATMNTTGLPPPRRVAPPDTVFRSMRLTRLRLVLDRLEGEPFFLAKS